MPANSDAEVGQLKSRIATLEQLLAEQESSTQVKSAELEQTIEELRQSSEALRESEERLRAQYKSIPIPTYTWRHVGDDFILIDYNDATNALSQGKASDFLGKSSRVVYRQRPDIVRDFAHVFEEKTSYTRETFYRLTITGEEKYFVISYIYVAPDLLMVHTEDITERRRAEAQNQFQARLLDMVGEAVIALNLDGDVIYWNHFAEQLYGWSASEVMGRNGWEIIVPIAAHAEAAGIEVQQRAGENWSGELLLQRRDGSTFPAIVTTAPIYDNNGTRIGSIDVSSDITARKRMEMALQQQRDFTDAVVDIVDSLIVVLDRQGRIVRFNRACERLTGYTFAEVERVNALELLLPPEELERVTADFKDITSGQFPNINENYWIAKDGSRRLIAWSNTALLDTDGSVEYVIGTGFDITERRQIEQALQRHAERLEGLRKVDQAILKGRSPQEIANAALTHLRGLIACERVSVSLLDVETREILLLAVHGSIQTAWETGQRLPFNLSALGDIEALQQGTIRVVNDLGELSDPPPVLRFLQEQGLRAYVNVPLLVQGALIGTLNLAANRPAAFGEEDLKVASEVAGQLAIAIEHARLFDQVRASREQLQSLSHNLLEAQETERRHIARELHDEIGQSLTALKINLHSLMRSAEASGVSAPLQESLDIVDHLLKQVRDLSLDLRPSMLDDLGLVAALRWNLDLQTKRAGLTARFVSDLLQSCFPPPIETACFRVAQEALTNIIRHAHAHHVHLEVRQRAGELELIIRDDGVGFDVPAALERAARGDSLGILSMQERILLVGGRIELQSVPSQGTNVRAIFPLGPTSV